MKTKLKKRIAHPNAVKANTATKYNITSIAEGLYKLYYPEIAKLSRKYRIKINQTRFSEVVKCYYASNCFRKEDFEKEEILEFLESAISIARSEGKRVLDSISIIKVFKEEIYLFKNATKEQLKATAYHEVGHYIANRELNIPIIILSIIPISNYVGINILDVDLETETVDINKIVDEVTTLLAGDISCELFLGKKDIGIVQDYEVATKELWYVLLGTRLRKKGRFLKQRGSYLVDGSINFNLLSNEQKNELSKQTDKLLKKAERKAKRILKRRRKQAKILVEALLQRGALTGEQAEMLYEGKIKLADLPPAKINKIQ